MSQRDHELMESATADTAISVPASPPPRDSMEDADPSLTRKRPRLDSGSTDIPAMHLDPDSTHNSTVPPEQLVQMTIRSQPPSSPQRPDSVGSTDDAPATAAPDDHDVRIPSVMAAAPGSPDHADHGSADSPPVIAIDDDDDDADALAAYPESASFHVDYDAETYFAMFPFNHSGNYVQAAHDIAVYFQGSGALTGNVLTQLTIWLDGLPTSHPSTWQSFFLDQIAFWDEIYAVASRVLGRRSSLGDQFSDASNTAEDIVTKFLSSYLRLVVHLTQVDAYMLSQWTSEEPYIHPIISQKHLRHVGSVLRQMYFSSHCNMFIILRDEYRADTERIQTQLTQVYFKLEGIRHLFALTGQAHGRIPFPMQNYLAVSAALIMDAILYVVFDIRVQVPGQVVNKANLVQDVLTFFRRYEADLQTPSKVGDVGVAKDLIGSFFTLIFDLCRCDAGMAAELVNEFLDFRDPESPTAASPEHSITGNSSYLEDPVEFPKLVANAWKFKLLRKYLVKGRMELRVMSIGLMDVSLVELWREYSGSVQSVNHPVMQYLADFLLHERVVDYIISVDSHPQLISRSGNIVGFLVVTRRYSNAQTDAIWNTISHSSDPRVVSATMTMLRGIYNLMDDTEQLYLCSKMYELPIESYNVDILRFMRDLAQKLLHVDLDWSETDPKARPWNVCIRMLQDTSPSKDSTKLTNALHNEAAEQLRSMAAFISFGERHELIRQCASCVTDNSCKATGSVRAIFILASVFQYGEPNFFKDNPDVVRHLLEEMCSFVAGEKDMVFSAQVTALQYRLELLCLLISGASDAIPADLYPTIWDHLIGRYAPTNHHRDMAWSKFLEAVKLKPDNDFCKQLVTVCVPKLDPLFYTPGMFDFVAAYRFPTARRTVTTKEGTKALLQIRGADLLWAMILSAPPQTIEDRAARLLASRYLEIDPHQGVSLDEIEEAHVALVEQCMEELLSVFQMLRAESATATSSADQMDFILPDTTRQQNEQRFSRTILFLKLLLGMIRNKPELNRSKRSDSKVEPLDMEPLLGDAIEVKYSSPVKPTKQTIVIGSENTLQDLYTRLCQTTGFTKVNLFAHGQRLSVLEKADEKIADLGLATQTLLVQKAPGAEISQPILDYNGNSSVFETTVLRHFDELFACMDADDHISFVVYDFLVCFPFQPAIVDAVTVDTTSANSLFPVKKPWQAKYAASALDNAIKAQVRKNCVDDKFLASAVRLLVQALLNPELYAQPLSSRSATPLASVLVAVLVTFLRERPAQEVSASYFPDERALVDRLLELMSGALNSEIDMGATAWNSYCAIIEASLHSRGIWDAFTNHSNAATLHGTLLLTDPRKPLREGVAKAISSVCGGALSPTSAITEADTATSFWHLISSVLPRAVEFPGQCEQLFELADQVFRKSDEYNRNEASLQSYLATWSALLLDYKHEENVGRDEIDFVVIGFTKLLLSCVSSLKSFKKPLNAGSLIEKIWYKFLFAPRLVEVDVQSTMHPQIPVLESRTRKELYDLVLALAEDRNSYGALIDLAENLGIDNANVTWRGLCIDRTNEIRSSTGYVGLFNPRAICYMNSLLTQLFMNVNFRKFILGLKVTDPRGAQILLHQTQKLFAEMQNSYRKSADPRGFAACVKAPEGTPIDINIQMDADEFYNLLFDQWEGQMLAPGIKEQFRSFYGGHTVNQIKSKECEHVSERVESFFVVQCDVQGKPNLIDSLQSFVEGDVMEGDNKYKCESCGGKLVDAVKRTCLKDVPDNLIFHLKRFDFDLVELRRAKINDNFEFPSIIDVSPFKVDHLSDPSKPRQEDIFELVGVLVHQGTSENGHYYSYIRERPTPSGSMHQWVEFNDRDVDAFDPQSLPYHAYGGFYDEQFQRQQKQFSAYMLFYQRRSAIEKDRSDYIGSTQSGIAKVPVPSALEQSIRADNDNFIREYSLYDPHHAKFVRHLLANVRTINHGTCSDDHQQETQALNVVLEHLCQTLFRMRNAENFEETLLQLRRTVLSCATCCHVALKWLAASENAMPNILLHCMYSKVRSQARAFLIDSLHYLREKDPVAYGIEATETDSESGSVAQTDGVLPAISKALYRVCEESHLSTRGWDDFYLTLCQLGDMGCAETAVLLDHRFLEFCLRMLTMHAIERAKDLDFWRIVDKKKRVFNRVIEFVYRLLLKIDIHLPAIQTGRVSRMDKYERSGFKFPLSRDEKQMLYYWDEGNKALAFLDKMLELFDPNRTELFYPGEILKLMLRSVDPRLQHYLFLTVYEGVLQLTPNLSDPYIRAALPYCEASPDTNSVERVIDVVGKHMNKYREGGGEVNIRFLTGLLKVENEAVFEDKGNDFFYIASLQLARKVSIHLLIYDDEVIRKATAAHLEELFTRHQDDEHSAEDVLRLKYKVVRTLAEDTCNKIVDEYQGTTARSYMHPMVRVCEMLVGLLNTLCESDDPSLEPLKQGNDWAIVQKFHLDVASRWHSWPMDESTPVSTGEPYDQSDYGSESDVDPELIDMES